MVDKLVRQLRNPAPDWDQPHAWRRAVWQTANRLGLTGVHALPLNPSWIDIQKHEMPLRGLDDGHVGMRIVQLSDLHYSPFVWSGYLKQHLRFVNELNPDLVIITGDLVSGGYRWVDRVARLLAHLRAPLGVVATLGNHDYSMWGKFDLREGRRRADRLASHLTARGLLVLRNETLHISPRNGGKPLAIVGLDDEWTGHIDPSRAFESVDPNQPIICLNHNPANARELLEHPWQWMLSGHTHGRALATSKFGKLFYPHRYRHYTSGYYALEGRHLYVNRGLSYGQRARAWCRPEITLFSLQAA
jgi:predicted MPP superfamily phosphohydrolase